MRLLIWIFRLFLFLLLFFYNKVIKLKVFT